MTWDVDGLRIHRVVEFVMPFEVGFFAEAGSEDVAAERSLVPGFVDSEGRYLMALQTFAIAAGSRRILVDTCVGNGKVRSQIPEFHHQHRPFLADLAAAGFAPDTVDTVVCTHLHVDHVGWNTHLVEGRWLPTFPRARYLFGSADLDYWAKSEDPLHAPAFADSVQPVIDAGLVEPVSGDMQLTDVIQLRPTPGHTPGHLSVWIGDHCVITGDALHHPIQCRHPDWTARGDADPDRARATRRELLTSAAAANALVLGTHFAGGGAGRVHSTSDGFRFAPEAPR